MRPALLVALLAGILPACAPPVDLPLQPAADEWVLGVLPDTQYYAARCPDIFQAQTDWLAQNADPLGLEFVVHLGDLTDDGGDAQWRVASEAMAALEGTVPYSILPGNHDIGVSGDARNRDGQIDTWFPQSRFESTLVSSFPEGSIANSFHRFETRLDTSVCVLALEFAPRQATVDWAFGQLQAHRDCQTILSTHAYLYDDGTRYDAALEAQAYHPDTYGVANAEEVFDGQELFQTLVQPNSQVSMVLCGHMLGDGVADRVTYREEDGSWVVEMLSNYQGRGPCGGDGFLRLIAVSERGLRVRTYSPTLDESLDTLAHSFDVLMD